jgi:hypothetical protein
VLLRVLVVGRWNFSFGSWDFLTSEAELDRRASCCPPATPECSSFFFKKRLRRRLLTFKNHCLAGELTFGVPRLWRGGGRLESEFTCGTAPRHPRQGTSFFSLHTRSQILVQILFKRHYTRGKELQFPLLLACFSGRINFEQTKYHFTTRSRKLNF